MDEKILTTMVATFTKALIDESKELVGELYDKFSAETQQFIGRDLKRYLTKQKDKYSHIKTLLRGNSPVFLYDIYYPLKLTYEDEVVITASISQLFRKGNYITIIGDAGSGKSTVVKHLFLNAIQEKYKIPILVELRYLNHLGLSFEEYIVHIITLNKVTVNSEILNRFFDKGKFVFFLDGYDELEEEKKKVVTREINEFVNKYDSNSFILTTRPYSNIEHLPLFINYRMKDLSLEDEEIKGFIYKQLDNEKEIAQKIVQSIEKGNQDYIESFLKNPLLLSLYILTFQSYAEIPDKKYIFYRRVINALFSEHDSKTKLGFVREKLSGLNQEEFETILKSFSFISYFDNQFSFDKDYVGHKLKLIKSKHSDIRFDNNKFIRDLKSAIALWVDDDGELSFTHRSLQEYFTALLIKELTPAENGRVYQKIVKRFEESEGRPMREVENLLQLLHEMDKYNYCKNYYLPLLLELRQSLDITNIKSLARSYVNFLTDGIAFRKERRKTRPVDKVSTERDYYTVSVPLPLVADRVNKTINLHLRYTRELYSFLMDSYDELRITSSFNESCSIASEVNEYRMQRYDEVLLFNDEMGDSLFEQIYCGDLELIAAEYLGFLNVEIKEVEEYLKNKQDVEKDIVDFI